MVKAIIQKLWVPRIPCTRARLYTENTQYTTLASTIVTQPDSTHSTETWVMTLLSIKRWTNTNSVSFLPILLCNWSSPLSENSRKYIQIYSASKDKYKTKLKLNEVSLLLTNHEGFLLSEFLVTVYTSCNNNMYTPWRQSVFNEELHPILSILFCI